MKRKKPMPSYYGKNIAQHAQKRALNRIAERRREKARRMQQQGRILLCDEMDTTERNEKTV